MRISDRIREIENAARQYAFVRQVVKVDETYYSVKYRLYIEPDLFVQLYFNERSGTVGLVLIHHGQRIYGRDSEAGCWHRHPIDDLRCTTLRRRARDLLAWGSSWPRFRIFWSKPT